MNHLDEQDGWLDRQAELWSQPQPPDESPSWRELVAQSERRHRAERLEYFLSQSFVLGSMGAVIWSVVVMLRQAQPLWVVMLALSFLPLGVYLCWRGRYFWRLKRDVHVEALTQSLPRLEAELEVNAREQRWMRRLFPFLLGYACALSLSVLLKTPTSVVIAAALLVALIHGVAAYVIYVRMPKTLRERAQRLGQLMAELEQI